MEVDSIWLKPPEMCTDLDVLWQYALTFDGYHYAREYLNVECGELANTRRGTYAKTGKWEGTFEELRCCLFFEQRRYHHFGRYPEGEDLEAIWALYREIHRKWADAARA